MSTTRRPAAVMENLEESLCSRCKSLDLRALASSRETFRLCSVSDLDRSAQTDCSLCKFLLYHVRPEKRSTEQETVKPLEQAVPNSFEHAIKFVGSAFGNVQNALSDLKWVYLSVPEKTTDEEARGRLDLAEIHMSTGRLGPSPDAKSRTEFLVAADARHQLVTSQLVIDDPISVENIAEAVLAWRRKCHDTHECWKPLAERRSPETSYIQTAGTEEVMRQSTYYIRGRRLPPMQSVDPPEIEPENHHLDDVPLPSRCLEIVRCADSEDFRFRLRQTTSQRGKYIILSHRWVPDTERVRTLKSNLEHRLGFRDGVPADEPPLGPEDLTSVFLDAAILSWQLGVPYIWIDSLCIVQDDGNDWARESAKMGSYYQNAWLTIAGAATNPTTGGLFGAMNAEELPPVARIPLKNTNGEADGYLSIQAKRLPAPYLTRQYDQSITKTELLERGWVFQEWILSTRLVTFSRAGVFLICSATRPESAMAGEVALTPDQLASDKSYKSDLSLSMVCRTDIFISWRKIIRAYSGLNLTKFEQDRLVALSGVAEEFSKALHRTPEPARKDVKLETNKYLCGLWRDDLVLGLQWQPVRKPGFRPTRVAGLPSWSWASVGPLTSLSGDDTAKKPVQVDWPMSWSWDLAPRFTVLDVMPVPVNKETFTVDYAAASPGTSAADDFGFKDRFLALHIRGKLVGNLEFGHPWSGERELKRVAEETFSHWNDRPDDLYISKAWKQIRARGRRVLTMGWALFDDIDFAGGEGEVLAFALAKDHLKTASRVVAVVLVTAVGTFPHGTCYRRVGVGRLCGESAKIRRVEESEFWLV